MSSLVSLFAAIACSDLLARTGTDVASVYSNVKLFFCTASAYLVYMSHVM